MTTSVQPLISIVTSNFNQGRYIKNLISWLRKEKRSHHELIVVDALSTDTSLEIIGKAGDLVDRLNSAADKGPADGWRRGVELATGKYVIFVSADDALVPGALSRIEAAILAFPDIDIFLAHGLIVDERNHRPRFFYSNRPNFSRFARGIGVACQQSTVYRRNLLSNIPINVSNNTCWDIELLVDCLAAGATVKRIGEIWGVFRRSHESISGRLHTNESRSPYANDKNNIAAKHGLEIVSQFTQTALGRIEKVSDPEYYRVLWHAKRFRKIRSMDSLWPV